MSESPKVPSLRLEDAAWRDTPPDPLDDPALYDGVAWRRVVAYGLDLMVLAVLGVCAWFVVGLIGILSFGLLTPLGAIVLAALPFAYHTLFLGARAATPGMRALDLEVRSWDGPRPDYLQALAATVLFYATIALTAWLILAVALFNDRRRTLHDYIAGTLVVRRSRIAQYPGA